MDFVFNTLRYIGILFLVVMVFNLMILVHEWGHFLAAKWRGLKVEKFYIWFGKPIWKKTINGVEYGLGSIPAGGFVALPQMAPMDAIEGESDTPREALPPITPLDKIIVAFAGPLFSFMLACVFAVIVWQVGKPVGEDAVTTEIGYVVKDSAGDKAGLKAGDVVKTIDGEPAYRFRGLVDSVQWLVIASKEDNIKFVVDRPGEGEKTISVAAEKPPLENQAWWQGFFARPQLREAGIAGKQTPMVGKTIPYSPAEEAGLKPSDLITAVDGVEIRHPAQFMDYVKANPDKALALSVKRGDQMLNVSVTPRVPDHLPAAYEPNHKLIGIDWDRQGQRRLDHPKPQEQIKDALMTMVNTIKAIATPKGDVGAGHLSGPIGIGRVYYTLFEDSYGWQLVLWFSVVLNVNLAVMNMLPFPVLDGGHITMAILEWIRKRPLNLRVLEFVQTACVFLLLGFMVFVTMKDVGDLFGGGRKAAQDVPRFLPPAERAPAAPAN